MERKDFIKNCALLCGSGLVGAALIESCKKNPTTPALSPVNFTIDLTNPNYASLKNVGGYITYDNAIVIKTAATTYVAMSDICTHAGCTVGYDNTQSQIFCPCHGGTYNMSGNVVSGPPPSGLVQYRTVLNGNSLTVSSS